MKSLILLSVLALCACRGTKSRNSLPACVAEEITRLGKEEVQNPPAEVWKYEVTGQTYYYFSAPCCDQFSRLVDSKCNYVCAPDGGFTGKGDGNCPDLSQAEKTLIRKDPRN